MSIGPNFGYPPPTYSNQIPPAFQQGASAFSAYYAQQGGGLVDFSSIQQATRGVNQQPAPQLFLQALSQRVQQGGIPPIQEMLVMARQSGLDLLAPNGPELEPLTYQVQAILSAGDPWQQSDIDDKRAAQFAIGLTGLQMREATKSLGALYAAYPPGSQQSQYLQSRALEIYNMQYSIDAQFGQSLAQDPTHGGGSPYGMSMMG